jgi:integrase
MKKFKKFLLEAVEDWKDQIASNDETGKKYRVKDIYDFAKSKKEFLIKDLPIKDTDALEWWDKQYDMDNKEHKERMEKADTSVPVLGIRQKDGTISITDGLNRIKKAHSMERKKTIPAYVIDKSDMENIKPVE